jgi:hypothetical protein
VRLLSEWAAVAWGRHLVLGTLEGSAEGDALLVRLERGSRLLCIPLPPYTKEATTFKHARQLPPTEPDVELMVAAFPDTYLALKRRLAGGGGPAQTYIPLAEEQAARGILRVDEEDEEDEAWSLAYNLEKEPQEQRMSYNSVRLFGLLFTAIRMCDDKVEFQSEGIVVNTHNHALMHQLTESLRRSDAEMDATSADPEKDLEMLGALGVESRRICLELERAAANSSTEQELFLTLHLPLGWSRVGVCVWINVSRIHRDPVH